MLKFNFDSGVFNGGLNLNDDTSLLKNNQLADCQNIIYNEQGYPEKRPPVFTLKNQEGKSWNLKTGKNIENIFTYKKRSGIEYLIAYSDKKVYYSTNLNDWTALNSSFDFTDKVRFCVFCDNLIIFNGIDDVYYWDGDMDQMEKIGAPVLSDSGSGTTVTNGIHKCKITYEDNGGGIYWHGVNSSINITNNHEITISNIPLCSEKMATGTRKIWITTAGTDNYYLFETLTDDTITTTTFNIDDTTLSSRQNFTDYISGKSVYNVQVPKCKFFEVFEGRLHGVHAATAPSEWYWSEINSFEDFPLLNVNAIDIDSGDYITGIKHFKNANQLIIFKLKSKYIGYSVSDTYAYKPASKIGCSFPDSIQELSIADEYGERATLIYANNDGIWEWNGNTDRLVSTQPNGSSIQKIWTQAKQREQEFKKHIITTTSDFENGIVSDINNYFIAENNNLTYENLFDWKETDIYFTSGFACWCFNPVDKKIYAMADGASGAYPMKRLSFNTTTRKWEDEGQVIFSGIFYPIKMEYDSVTGRIYVICANGKIYRTNTSITDWDGFKTFDVNNLDGERTMTIVIGKYFRYTTQYYYFISPYNTTISVTPT
ncbi:MAG TPA: hypothetical protein PLF61_00980, partial [Candidatus Goldiibacteriota bacterium]|nr:hypothetical protein [Candidatus Goldiibacteriota bacterium]